MADYYPLIARAVSNLGSNTGKTRQALYERARTVLVAQLRGQDPPVPESDIMRESNALEAAIRKVDAEWSSFSNTKQGVPGPAPNPAAIPGAPIPLAVLNMDRVSDDELSQIAPVKPTAPDQKLPANLASVSANAIKTVGTIMLSIACFAAVVFIPVIFILGVTWVSVHVFTFLVSLVCVALMLCVLIFMPAALFRKTRFASVYGFLISSYLFGVTTWVLGFLTTLQYWGAIGVFIGLFLGFVGIVPLGIMASAFHADWSSVVALIVGLFVTYGARTLSFALAASLER
jgi:hypothetical protein